MKRPGFIFVLVMVALLLVAPAVACYKKPVEAPEPTKPAETATTIPAPTPPSTVSELEVSQEGPLEELVLKSDLIVLGTITDLRYEVEVIGKGQPTQGKRAWTIFTLSVEKVIKGDPDTTEVFIKAMGGPTGTALQAPVGPYFSISQKVLVCLIKLNDQQYAPLWNGLLWTDAPHVVPPPLRDVIGLITTVMKKYNIAIPQDS